MRIQLMPGVFLTAVQSDKFKTGICSVNLLRPLTDRDASCAGLTMRVLLQGTQRYPSMEKLTLAQEAVYGAEISDIIRKKGEVLSVGLFAEFIEDVFVSDAVFSKVAELVAEILLHPAEERGAFCSAFVAREKEGVIHEIRARINSKRTYAVTQTVQAMCKDEPYGIDKFGSEKTVLEQTPQSLFAYYKELLETSQIEICYLGRQNAEAVADVMRACIGSIPRGECVQVATSPNPTISETKEITESLAVTQGKLCMGFRITDGAESLPWEAFLLFNAVFGSGVTSKLFLNVREKLSLCYYASSSLERYKRLLIVDSGVDFSNFEAARGEILRQLEDCRAGFITEDELESARKGVLSRWRAAQDAPAQIDEFHLGQAILQSEDTMENVIGRIASVTKQQVVTAANAVVLDTVYYLKGLDT